MRRFAKPMSEAIPTMGSNPILSAINMKDFFISTVGCQMNVSDSERLSSGLKSLGLEKSEDEKAKKGDMVVFDYTAKIDGKSFEGGEGKNLQIVLGRDLFIKGFDNQLIGVKKNENKIIKVKLPQNYPKKELANKKTDFDCKIIVSLKHAQATSLCK